MVWWGGDGKKEGGKEGSWARKVEGDSWRPRMGDREEKQREQQQGKGGEDVEEGGAVVIVAKAGELG